MVGTENRHQTFKSNISSKVSEGLVKRWAFFDKSYSVADIKKDMKTDIKSESKKKRCFTRDIRF